MPNNPVDFDAAIDAKLDSAQLTAEITLKCVSDAIELRRRLRALKRRTGVRPKLPIAAYDA